MIHPRRMQGIMQLRPIYWFIVSLQAILLQEISTRIELENFSLSSSSGNVSWAIKKLHSRGCFMMIAFFWSERKQETYNWEFIIFIGLSSDRPLSLLYWPVCMRSCAGFLIAAYGSSSID